METPKRLEQALIKLYNAFHNNRLDPEDCTACAVGRAQSAPGQTSCLQCAAGKMQSKTASVGCEHCEAGKYQPSTGQTSCDLCPKAKYQNAVASQQCLECAAGRYNNQSGAAFCHECSHGRSSSTGDFGCFKSAQGYFYHSTKDEYIPCGEDAYKGVSCESTAA